MDLFNRIDPDIIKKQIWYAYKQNKQKNTLKKKLSSYVFNIYEHLLMIFAQVKYFD